MNDEYLQASNEQDFVRPTYVGYKQESHTACATN